MKKLCAIILFLFSFFPIDPARAQSLTFVELNCENLFDYKHDSLKQDQEYRPEAVRRWTKQRYWRKLNNIQVSWFYLGLH